MTKVEKQIRYSNRVPVETVNSVRAILGKDPNDYVITLGNVRKGDSDAREYYWDGLSTGIDDSDWVLKPTVLDQSDSGRWLKVGKPVNKGSDINTLKETIVGNGTAVTYIVPHTFPNTDIMISVFNILPQIDTLAVQGETVETGQYRTLSEVIITFKTVPQLGEEFRVLMINI